MTRLERRYRRLLRVLPAWYRRDREEEMVDAFLADRDTGDPDEDIDLEYGWPGWTETRAVVALGCWTRLGYSGAPPKAVVLRQAVRLGALLGLLVHGAFGVVFLGYDLVYYRTPSALSPFPLALNAAAVLASVVAFAAMLRGRYRPAKVCAVLLLVPGVPTLGEAIWSGRLDLAVSWLPLWITVGCVVAGFGPGAPRPPARPWLLGAAAAVVLFGCWFAVTALWYPWSTAPLGGPDAITAWAVIVGGLWCLARRRSGRGAWALVLAVTAGLVLAQRLVLLQEVAQARAALSDIEGTVGGAVLPSTVVQVIGLVAVGVALVAVGVRDVRRLPAEPAPAPAG